MLRNYISAVCVQAALPLGAANPSAQAESERLAQRATLERKQWKCDQ
jgi:hypothetical protein